MNNNTYATFDLSELYKVNFNEVLQTDGETIRISVDGLKGILSWTGGIPSSVKTISTLSPLYNQDEMIDICLTSEWDIPFPPIN